MATEDQLEELPFVTALTDADWQRVTKAVSEAGAWLSDSAIEDRRRAVVTVAMANAAMHRKWEVRQAVAEAIAGARTADLDATLDALVVDSHPRVKKSAERSKARRAASERSSDLGREHDARVLRSLEQIETLYGKPVRQAAKRVGEEIAETFTRELYHEMAKLMAPLLTTTDRVRVAMMRSAVPAHVVSDLNQVESQIRHVRAVLDAMKSYAAVPRLAPRSYRVVDLVDQACSFATQTTRLDVPVEVTIPDGLELVVDRTRMIQALANLVANAIEATAGQSSTGRVVVSANETNGYVVVVIADHGGGMSEQRMREARELFASTKSHGTGFGVPLAAKVIESEHSGRLRYEANVGGGTRTIVALPAARP
jgi:signal transduction histidine kinase